jgi:hypothetical protein
MRFGLGIKLPGPFWASVSVGTPRLRRGGGRGTSAGELAAWERKRAEKLAARIAKAKRRDQELATFGRSLTRAERKKREAAIKRWGADRAR